MPKTKIVATLGPASANATVMRKMFVAGLDVVRLNFSHGTHASHAAAIDLVRTLNKKYRRHIRIMQDLEGFRIRIGRFEGAKTRELKNQSTLWLTNDESASGPKTIPFDYTGDLTRIKRGQLIFIDDGNLILRVKEASAASLKCVVIEGGILKERKGINMPGANLQFDAMTDKDKKDLQFGIEHKVDYVSLSFVRNAADVNEVAELLKPHLPKCGIIAKIENRQAIDNIDEIIAAADGIMIARGDMGVAIPIYEVPIVQKHVIRKCNAARKFVITATQMLEHMTEHSRPTRAEVTDVANAILDGTDYVMLSGETAAGKFPSESVAMMNDIIKFTEQHYCPICRDVSLPQKPHAGFPRKFKHLIETEMKDVEAPDYVWLTYAVCACEKDACGWGGWMLEAAFKKTGKKHLSGTGDKVLSAAMDQVCPRCGKTTFRTAASIKMIPSPDQTPVRIEGRDHA